MKLTEKQLEQIRAQIKRVKEFGNPFYTERFKNVNPEDIKTQEDFENLVPFVSKQDLRDAYPLGLATVPEEEIVRIHSSSGTTGAPVVIPYTKKEAVELLSKEFGWQSYPQKRRHNRRFPRWFFPKFDYSRYMGRENS